MNTTLRQSEPTLSEAQLQAEPAVNPVVNSRDVLRGQQELQIDHGGALYILRVTRQGKLILTK